MNAMASSYQQYKKHDVMMATPIELIIMLYSGCIKRLKLARIAIEKKDHEDANTQLQKAQDIIVELINGLDFQYSIAAELFSLYDFIHNHIIKINISKDAQGIEPIIGMLNNLRGTWVKVQAQNRSGAYQFTESES